MRRFILAALTVVLLSACSKTEIFIPDSGLYVTQTGDLVIALEIDGGECIEATFYVDGRYAKTCNDIETTGRSEFHGYSFENFSISASYNDSRSFRGTLDGYLHAKFEREEISYIFDKTSFDFIIHDEKLDADDDGILDVYPIR